MLQTDVRMDRQALGRYANEPKNVTILGICPAHMKVSSQVENETKLFREPPSHKILLI